MPTVTEVARHWRVSKGIVSRYAGQGMPLKSFDAAERWIARNVPFGKLHRAAETARLGPLRLEPETPDPREDDLTRLVTHAEFASLLEIEFQRFEAEAPKRRKSKTLPVSFCPSLMVAVWAVKGFMAYAKTTDPKGATLMVSGLMEEIREGNGDYLFKGLTDNPDEKLSKGFYDEVLAEDVTETKG